MLYVIHLSLHDPKDGKLRIFYYEVVILLMFGLFIGNLIILVYFDQKYRIFE